MLLRGKTVLVYGASGAVGGAVAKAYAREGATVVLAARNAGPLEGMAEQIYAAGGKAIVTTVDALDQKAVEAHLADIVAETGPIKAMFNAIAWGDSQGSMLTELDEAAVMLPILSGLKTWFYTGTAMARHMQQHGGGVIVGITANAGREAYSHMGGFGIACAAVEHYLRHLGVENGQFGVRVCWVRSPGSPDAPGVREVWQLHANERGMTLEDLEIENGKGTPLRRVTALAQIADAAVLLTSDLAAGMTMTVANATGGAQID